MIDRKLNYGRHLIKGFLNKKTSDGLILDLGAGHGDDLIIAKEECPNASLFAIEVYQKYAEELREKNIEVYSVNIERERLPLNDKCVDVVIANQILEHTKELFWIFHEVTRVLDVGGRFVIGVPNLASFHNRLLLLLGRQPTPIKNYSAHVRGFTKRDLINFVESCFPGGYELTNFGGSNFYPFPPYIARILAKFLPNMAWGIFLEFEKRKDYNREFLEYPVDQNLETNFYLGDS